MFKVKVPMLPESIIQAKVVAWHKNPGDTVVIDEPIVDIETDKVVIEIPSEVSGVMGILKAKENDIVTEGQVLVEIDVSNHNSDGASLGKIEGIYKTAEYDTKTQSQSQVGIRGGRKTERVEISHLRKALIRKLRSVSQNTVMATTFNEVDMTSILYLKNEYKDAFMNKYNAKLGLMSFFVKSSVEALKKFPTINAYLDKDEVVYHAYCDISIAISTDKGLMAPVLRNAHKMAMHDIERKISDYVNKAKSGNLQIDEISGGTFTITNGGVFGSLLSTPIINAPQSAILGMHKIQKRAVVINDEIVIKPMMNLALTYDHQIIDGREAIQFLSAIKDLLEDPIRLLLKI